ncbi:MAG: helix-turn-helix domain-containing protein [archaeon]
MELKRLGEIGLTEGEVKVYLALLRLGLTKTGQLALKAGVSSSKVYKILGRLEKKGLAGHVIKGKIKYYKPMEPERLLDYLNEKEKEFSEKRAIVETLMPELKNEQASAAKLNEAVIYQGFKGVSNFFKNLIDELQKGDCYYVIGAYYGNEAQDEVTARWRDFFFKHHLRRTSKGIKVKMLANYDIKGKMVKTTQKNSEIRFLPQYLVTNMEIVFYKNKSFIAIFTSEPVGFLIENEEATLGFKKYFEAFWKIAEKS